MADDLHDSYRVLQLEPGASLPMVKRAYRQLVKMWHPDHFAPGSKMEQKAQEKLKEINQAYERLCKSRGQNPAADDVAEAGRKARKAAAATDDEPAHHHGSSRKAEEEPMADPAARRSSRRVGDLDDEEPAGGPAPPRGTRPAEVRFHPGRWFAGLWRDRRIRRRILLGAAVMAAGALAQAALPRGFWRRSWKTLGPAASTAESPPANAADGSVAPARPGEEPPIVRAPAPQAPISAAISPSGVAAGPSEAISHSAPASTPAVLPWTSAPFASPGTAAGKSVPASAGGSPAESAPPEGAPPAAAPAPPPPAPPPVAAPPPPARFAAMTAPKVTRFFTVGSTKQEVIDIQGTPDSFGETKFQYGSSEVVFRNGRVESWRDGNPRLKARWPTDLSDLDLDTFTVGSWRDEVIAIQGKPDAVTPTTLQYGSSVVYFRDDRVASWREGNPRLKTRLLPASLVSGLDSFTVGSPKDEVVEVQGLPDKYTDSVFQYGTSVVYFENGRVSSWVSGNPPLKAHRP